MTNLHAFRTHFLRIVATWATLMGWSLWTMAQPTAPQAPKLVVGIVVDQMRYDYLTRYWDRFGPDGFRRLVGQGFFCRNTHYNYLPTDTGPGHASIYSGTTPAWHGIVGNNWLDRALNRDTYCASDTLVSTVGAVSISGLMSPRNLLATTVTDELRLATNMQGKVVGLSLKDRGAIFPAGHNPNGAYWLDALTGRWITSTWYMDSLPTWVRAFNDRKLANQFLSGKWETLYPIETYTASWGDNSPYEKPFPGEKACVFPHQMDSVFAFLSRNAGTKSEAFDVIKATPFGNTLLAEFAKTAIVSENLGKDNITDILTVSFSGTDYIGHQTSTRSVETEDVYLRLDQDLGKLLQTLDQEVGKGNYLVFLTADHGGATQPAWLMEQKMPAGNYNRKETNAMLTKYLTDKYGQGEWFSYQRFGNFFLNRGLIAQKGLKLADVQLEVAEFLLRNSPAYWDYVTGSQLETQQFTQGMKGMAQMGYNRFNAPDIYMIPRNGWLDYNTQGSDHGTGYAYDTHVPLLWYGWKVTPGETNSRYHITDIAPTVSSLLRINFPSACVGNPIPLPMKK